MVGAGSINPSVLGKTRSNRPEIAQVMFKKMRQCKQTISKEIYSKQKKIEKVARDKQIKDFYICSFSSRSIVYKGVFLAEMLSEFYRILMTKN